MVTSLMREEEVGRREEWEGLSRRKKLCDCPPHAMLHVQMLLEQHGIEVSRTD